MKEFNTCLLKMLFCSLVFSAGQPRLYRGIDQISSYFPAVLASESDSLGSIVSVQGKVWLVRSGLKNSGVKGSKEARREAVVGARLQQGDTLITESKSEAKLVLAGKDAALQIKPETTITLRREIHESESRWRIDFQSGMLFTHVQSRPNQRVDHFQIRTKSAVMGVRGTTLFVKQEENADSVFLCTCVGLVALDNKVLIFSKHHDTPKKIRFGKESLVSRMTEAPVGTEHSDTEAVALADLLK